MALSPPSSPASAGSRPGHPVDNLISVVLAEDHALMRGSLRRLLTAEVRVDLVAESNDLSTLEYCVSGNRPDVLVIDLSMSNGTSLEVIRRLRRAEPNTQIVVLTMNESRVFAREAHKAGALGLVIKQSADEELLDGVLNAARREAYVSPRVGAPSPDEGTARLAEDETYGNGR